MAQCENVAPLGHPPPHKEGALPRGAAPPSSPPRYPDTLLAARRAGAQFSLADFSVPRAALLGQGQFGACVWGGGPGRRWRATGVCGPFPPASFLTALRPPPRAPAGQVLRVVERASRAQLVLKKVSKQALLEEGAVRQFQREVEIHCRLFHPHIARMFAYFHDEASCYLLLELAELGSLYSRIQAGRLPEREAAGLFRQLASAVAHLHARGVLHRDIKPENVFLGRGADGGAVVKLGDFGWSIVKRAASKRTTLCGTIEYLPPEVCKGAEAQLREGRALVGGMSLGAEYDEAFDAYTLGALLYEMLVGHSPYAGPAYAGVPGAMAEAPLVGRILAGSFLIPVALRLPSDVQTLIRALMAKEPGARPSVAAVLGHPWLLRHAGATPRAEWDY